MNTTSGNTITTRKAVICKCGIASYCAECATSAERSYFEQLFTASLNRRAAEGDTYGAQAFAIWAVAQMWTPETAYAPTSLDALIARYDA